MEQQLHSLLGLSGPAVPFEGASVVRAEDLEQGLLPRASAADEEEETETAAPAVVVAAAAAPPSGVVIASVPEPGVTAEGAASSKQDRNAGQRRGGSGKLRLSRTIADEVSAAIESL